MSHDHTAVPAASRHTRRIVLAVLVPAALATLIALIVLWPGNVKSEPDAGGGRRAVGTVSAVLEQACPAGAQQQRCGSATVRVTEGPGTGTDQKVDLPQGPGTTALHVGDGVVLIYFPDAVPGGNAYSVVDRERSTPLVWLVVVAVAVILAFGRWRGVTSLAGLAVSFGILLLFVVPAILDGSPPLLIAVVGASAIMFAALYLTHGINVHTSVAVAGTLASLVLTGVLGALFTSFLHLSGVGSDDSSYLSVTREGLDLRGLLLAGIVIGALGVLDDVTVTQAVTVAEMTPGATSRLALYRSAIRVGRAHVASAVNTIVLAYAGASLPLLLLIAASSEPITELLTSEFLAQEILRSAVGTIGLVASVPITTALAALVADLRPETAPARHSHRAH
ncbi:YibE/F family protein [Actinoplanes friuliensis]|uniref:Yibe/f family protein n=1 Tax=Actinoplanes friuliensis DSM 7358 TaxID=1246995 RepID=U5VZJ6_9ACTN|nr:YibE/F family protein [Actinoplanes friuliensis]AGZ42314.1 yibe/f family protein [Actinoplanes friuliensis DSM 7358]